MSAHYDVLIIGTGAGGGALAHRLALAGKRILILERGTFLPREEENWNTTEVFLKNRYHTREVWTDKTGKDLHPGTGYWVGGNTKVYGAALFRLRERQKSYSPFEVSKELTLRKVGEAKTIPFPLSRMNPECRRSRKI
jgi:choline dehydrogenase-like flavoprotein